MITQRGARHDLQKCAVEGCRAWRSAAGMPLHVRYKHTAAGAAQAANSDGPFVSMKAVEEHLLMLNIEQYAKVSVVQARIAVRIADRERCLQLSGAREYARTATRSDMVFQALKAADSSRFKLHALVCKAARRLHYPNNRIQATINRVLVDFAAKGILQEAAEEKHGGNSIGKKMPTLREIVSVEDKRYIRSARSV